MEEYFVTFFVLIFLIIYFLPTIISITRRNNIVSVLLINLFLGWSVIGYFAALWLAIFHTKEDKLRDNRVIVNNNIIVNTEKNAQINQKNEPQQKNISEPLRTKTIKLTEKQKNILIVCCGVLGGLIAMFLCVPNLEDENFYQQNQIYKENSQMFNELFECKNIEPEEYREELCRCIYEFSIKKEKEYYAQKDKIQNKKYEYSFQKTKDLNKLAEAYQMEAVGVCDDIIQ